MRIVDLKLLALVRAGPWCEFCWTGKAAFHTHHLHPRARGRVDVLENLVCLCAACHQKHHARPKKGEERKWPTYEMLLALVASREGSTPDEVKQLYWDLRRVPKGAHEERAAVLLAFRGRCGPRRPPGPTPEHLRTRPARGRRKRGAKGVAAEEGVGQGWAAF